MDANDIADSLTDRQVVKFISEEDNRHEVGHALTIDSTRDVCDFESGQIFLGLKGLMWESRIKDDGIKIDVLADFAFLQRLVVVATLFVSFLEALF